MRVNINYKVMKKYAYTLLDSSKKQLLCSVQGTESILCHVITLVSKRHNLKIKSCSNKLFAVKVEVILNYSVPECILQVICCP